MEMNILLRLLILFVIFHTVLAMVPSVMFRKFYWKLRPKDYFDHFVENFGTYMRMAWIFSWLYTLLFAYFFYTRFADGSILYSFFNDAIAIYTWLTMGLFLISRFMTRTSATFESN